MNAEAFWCITLSTLILRWWWKGQKFKYRSRMVNQAHTIPPSLTEEEIEAAILLEEAEKRKRKDIADLKKQGYSDELITTILPIINDK